MNTFDGFIEAAVKSGLVSREQMAEAASAVQVELSPAAPANIRLGRLIQLAIERDLLTAWQCDKLREGRYKGFFLGRYKLVNFLGSTAATSRYLAETSNGSHFEVLVSPVGKQTRFIVIKPDSFIEDDAIDT
jgi:serine/threonine-protein kinase